jgi:hypothetical protein
MSVHGDIQNALAARLATITAANGYATNVLNVYHDEIPMGLDLNDYQLPAIFLLSNLTQLTTQFPKVIGRWQVNLQLWHTKVADSVMYDFVRDVYKAIYADSPTAQVNGSFRALHPKVVEVRPLSLATDLQMIEANRVFVLSFEVHYRTELFDM